MNLGRSLDVKQECWYVEWASEGVRELSSDS